MSLLDQIEDFCKYPTMQGYLQLHPTVRAIFKQYCQSGLSKNEKINKIVSGKLLPADIAKIIGGYVTRIRKYRLLDWVNNNSNRLSIENMCGNPRAIDYLVSKYGENLVDRMGYIYNRGKDLLLQNPAAKQYIIKYVEEFLRNKNILPLLELQLKKYIITNIAKNPDPDVFLLIRKLGVDFTDYNTTRHIYPNPNFMDVLGDLFMESKISTPINELSSNPDPRVIKFLRQNRPYNIDWILLSRNSGDAAVDLLLENPRKIHWSDFCRNTNPRAIKFIEYEYNQDRRSGKLDWRSLSSNSGTYSILSREIRNPECQIQLEYLSQNRDQRSISRILDLDNCQGAVNWQELSKNSAAIQILRDNQDRIDWRMLSYNPGIFESVESKYQKEYTNIIQKILF